MTEAPPIPASEKLRAIERELGYRRTVYPRRVMDRKMTQKQSDWQIAVMEAIRDDYEKLAKEEQLL
jgi:hypothetical protein